MERGRQVSHMPTDREGLGRQGPESVDIWKTCLMSVVVELALLRRNWRNSTWRTYPCIHAPGLPTRPSGGVNMWVSPPAILPGRPLFMHGEGALFSCVVK